VVGPAGLRSKRARRRLLRITITIGNDTFKRSQRLEVLPAQTVGSPLDAGVAAEDDSERCENRIVTRTATL